MMVPGWRLEQWLGTTRASRIARARPTSEAADDAAVLLKVAVAGDSAEFRREYALAQSLSAAGIFRPRTLWAEGSALAMVLDDGPLVSLETLLSQQPLGLPACLRAAQSIVRALGALHAARLVHGDVRPANLLVDPRTDEVLIVDLSAAAERSQAPDPVKDWAYLSPEQTGRTGRTIDHRSDFYACGVLLYRMLCGWLPFQANDPLEWLHCQIARTPDAPVDVVPQLPRMVSDLVMKLLAKAPEDRYRSAHGLHVDLQRCLAEWEATGAIESFSLGREDVAEQLQIPQKLYGRVANAKVELIDQQQAQMRQVASEVPLDTLAVVKASQALSECINLHDLLEALLRIALENSGAQTGQVYLADGEQLLLWASAQVHGDQLQVHVLDGEQQRTGPRPDAILHVVRRSHEQMLLPDAGEMGPFAGDDYLQQRRPKSVLCLPLLRRTDLIGVLYLENNLATHAFTPERVTVLSLLASQAAISVETARLYAALKAENAQRQRAERVSLERQSRIQRLVESNIIGMRIAYLDGLITEANDAFLQIIGYTREDVAAGRLNHLAITPPEYHEAGEGAREELLRKGRFTPFEKEYFRKDGTRVPVLVGGMLFDGSPGTPAQSVVFALDLTERRRAEAEHEARRVAEVANRAKSDFLATMSHELRTPLNGILGYAQLLAMDGGLSERQSRGINIIRQSGDHLLSLINDILDLSRVEAGRVEFSPTPVDLAVFLSSVADIIRIRAEQKDLIFVFNAAPDLPEMVMVDERRLRQVLLNLLGNAVKFTDTGTVSLQVCSKGREEGCSLLLMEVADTGVGIKPEDVSTIFEPFAQVGDLKRREAGTGLGLTITQALVRAMGGDICVESSAGRGSRFSFQLRLQDAGPLAARHASVTKAASYGGRPRRILIVDDVAQNRALLTDFLSVSGFETQFAEDGLKGLQMFKVFHPDLVVMDSVMPVMTGLEATRLLRQDPRFGSVPIIAISASATEEHRQKCLDAGANLYMSKPVRLDELVTGIKRLLQLEWIAEMK